MSDPDPDYGKAAREDYKKQNAAEEAAHPEIDRAYLAGEDQPDPVGLTKPQVAALRKKLAEKASRYLRPTGGYKNGDPRQGPEPPPSGTSGQIKLDPAKEDFDGGGIYLRPEKAKGRADKDICDSVYHWVEDMFWPKKAEPKGSDKESLKPNSAKADAINKGDMDIGKRLPEARKSGWFCGEQAQFLAWLLRQLGYKVQYKNIIPSTANSKPPNQVEIYQQTAAINVWYAGAWHLYDPFESFSDADGGLDAYVNKTGDVAAPYSDAYVYIWERGDYEHFSWDAPKGGASNPYTENYLDYDMKQKGWKKGRYIAKSAGASVKSMRSEIHIGLSAGGASCGWFDGDVHESWIGARYRPYGRPAGPAMGHPDQNPAKDERIDINLLTDTTLSVVLTVSNASDEATPYDIEMTLCQSNELRVSAQHPKLSGTLGPGAQQTYELVLSAKRIGWPSPAPVSGVRGVVQGNHLFLTWKELPGDCNYRVYRHDREIKTPRDLRQARLIRTVPLPCCELPWRGKRPLFFAVIAVDRRRRASLLDSEQGSSTVIMAPGRSSRRA